MDGAAPERFDLRWKKMQKIGKNKGFFDV